MQITFRPFDQSDHDYAIMVDLWNESLPEMRTDISMERWSDSMRKPEYFFHRVIAEDEAGRPVGYGSVGEAWYNETPNQYRMGFFTAKAQRRQGIAGQFYRYALTVVAEQGGTSLITSTREDFEDAQRFLTNRGFVLTMRAPRSMLDLTQFDRSRFGDPAALMAAQRIEILTLDQVRDQDPEWQRTLHELDWDIVQDVPSTDPHAPMPLDTFLQIFEAPDLLPAGWLVARDQTTGRYAGTSNIWYNPKLQPELFWTGLTGVRREYRRRGIATALKLRAIDLALSMGVTQIHTDNEENNPMLGINLRLGFVPSPGWLHYRKEFQGETGSE